MAKTGFYIGSTPIGKVTVAYKSITPSTLQEKSVVPTKTEQSVLPDTNYDALSKVTVAAIPDEYQNISEVTASAEDVIQGKKIVNSTGVVSGTMSDNGTVSKVLDTTTKSYTIPSGKHSGAGVVSITTQEKSVTPSTSVQEIVPDTGKVLSKVTVAAVTSSGTDTSDATATSGDILSGKTAYVKGQKVTGNIVSRNTLQCSVNERTVTIPAGYYAVGGSVSVNKGELASPDVSIIKKTGQVVATANVGTSGYISVNEHIGGKLQLDTMSGTTITPGINTTLAVASGKYTTGDVYVSGDSNLIAGNIKKGVSIFGVAGTYTGKAKVYAAHNITPRTLTPSSSDIWKSCTQITMRASDIKKLLDTSNSAETLSSDLYGKTPNAVVATLSSIWSLPTHPKFVSQFECYGNGYDLYTYYDGATDGYEHISLSSTDKSSTFKCFADHTNGTVIGQLFLPSKNNMSTSDSYDVYLIY